MKWLYSVNQIIEQHWQNIQQSPLFTSFDLYHLNQLRKCRTAALGGHINACDQCGHFQIAYNSCRNRHCPSCQGLKREEWILQQEAILLPVPYFHVVFTLPAELNGNYCATYLGTKLKPSSTSALHYSWWWNRPPREVGYYPV